MKKIPKLKAWNQSHPQTLDLNEAESGPGFSVSSRFLSSQGSKDQAHFVPLPASPLALLPPVRVAVQPAQSMIAVLHLLVETRIQ